MSRRTDTASRLIRAAPAAIWRGFADPAALAEWLPPDGMRGEVLAFDFRAGGSYRMRLTYEGEVHVPGKTSEHADEVEVRLTGLVEGRRLEQAVTFETDDPALSGTMRITWTLEPVSEGTHVTIRCDDVPEGIRQEDHEAGLTSSLANLAAFAEASEAAR